MQRIDECVPFQWHCVNCGDIVTGFRNSKGDIKVECKRCHTVMVRTIRNPKRDTFQVFAPAEAGE